MATALLSAPLPLLAADKLAAGSAPEKTNVIIILTDDLGYGDLRCYGSDRIKTPNIDRMAAEGMKFTDFYATAPICTPTRASIMTGCYPSRVGLGTPLHTPDTVGLNENEVTLAELLKSRGYATACIGKWHLGHHPEFYPTRHGFDFYFGTPLGHCFATEGMRKKGKFSDLFLRNEKEIPFPPFENLTEVLTAEAVKWIEANKNERFFLFLSHPMPHGPVAASERFRGGSAGGLYGDAVETIDWSTGEILRTIDELGLSQDTIVVFTSDNGADTNPWGTEATWFGSNTPFRGKKQQGWEGGLRVPCVMWAPGRIPAGSTCSELATVMDFLPTFGAMAGAELPKNRVIDGKDIANLLAGKPGAKSPYNAFIYHVRFGKRAGIRAGDWKLLVETEAKTWKHRGDALYNLRTDPGEAQDLASQYPDKVKTLKARLKAFEEKLSQAMRPAGRLDTPMGKKVDSAGGGAAGRVQETKPLKRDQVSAPEPSGNPIIEVARVDVHERLYPDHWPKSAEPGAISVPRGAPATFQFAVRAEAKGNVRLSLTGNIAGKPRLHWLQSVHVEGNTQGSLKNRPGGAVPKGWMNHLIRAAPFDTLEVLVEGNTMPIVAGRTHGVVVEVSVPKDAQPGAYKGALRISLGKSEAVAPFAFRVHRTALPDPLPIHSVHWLWPEPVNLTNGDVPEWWSEEHWKLLEAAGKQLHRFGDDTVYTPLVNYREPLIQITRLRNGTFAFDYSRFDRWADLFFSLGFRHLSGHHILVLNRGAANGGVYIVDEASGKKKPLLADARDREAWLAFLPTFYDSFHAHLKEKGWLDRYMQCQYDEPKDAKLYKRLASLARKHLPGIRTTDAINSSRQDVFSPLVDEQVFNLIGLNKYQQVAAQRNAEGKGVWLYHCTSPYPPHPNRHIDSHLTESRLYPWLCYKLGANGFLFWGANIYRGADEYKTSIGPFPNGSQNPGHPPGDNWFYYRSPGGLRPSIRIVSYREGLIDYALLTMLAKRDRNLARQLVAKIAPSITKFEREPVKYHQTRAAILETLDKP